MHLPVIYPELFETGVVLCVVKNLLAQSLACVHGTDLWPNFERFLGSYLFGSVSRVLIFLYSSLTQVIQNFAVPHLCMIVDREDCPGDNVYKLLLRRRTPLFQK